jgi:PAS domain S-box-containing protein
MSTGVKRSAPKQGFDVTVALSQLYKTVLELITTDTPLSLALDGVCKFVEQQFPGVLCSILLADAQGASLRHGAAPSLPAEYIKAIDGAKIAPNAGSCGTAAYRGEPVVVTDIATDPLWNDFRHLALPHNLRACWSTPIRSRTGKILGTFAVYYRESQAPRPEHLQMIESATHLSGIAIERDQAERNYRAAENRYRSLVEQLPAITYVAEVGVLGRWHYVSPQIKSILGISPEEWMSDCSNWVNHLHPDDRDRALAAETQFWEAGGTYQAEYRLLAKDGRALWFRDNAIYLKTTDGQRPVMQGVLYDITEHKYLEDQFRQAQKMEAVGQLAGGVAHDFNNLLMIMQGHNERLLRHLQADNPVYKDAVATRDAVDRAAALTRQLLAFSRKQVLQPQVLDLNTIVADVGQMLHRLIGENIQVKINTDSTLWVKVDQRQMEQVILNLALNARDAMPNGGTLIFETTIQQVEEGTTAERRPGRYAVLSVTDSGTGMDADTQSHIFEPFFTTKELGKGTGLGLASVYGVVTQSGGWVSFQSKLGHGTSFRIYLPEASAQPQTPAENISKATRTKGTETVLVVEDEDEIRDMVREYLERQGYTVLHASNGASALQIAQHYKGIIHLLVTDVVMPQLGGHELAHELKQLRPRVKVLFTSGYPEQPSTSDNGKMADHQPPILQKPYPLGVLATRIRQALDAGEHGTAAPQQRPPLGV